MCWYSERIYLCVVRSDGKAVGMFWCIRLYAIGPPYKYKDVENFLITELCLLACGSFEASLSNVSVQDHT